MQEQRQQRHDTNKVYSLREPQVYCLAKGEAHKPYEFGSTASVAMTAAHGQHLPGSDGKSHARRTHSGRGPRPSRYA